MYTWRGCYSASSGAKSLKPVHSGTVPSMQRQFWGGRPFIKWFAVCYRTILSCLSVCLSVLSVTMVYCGQTVGWIKTKLGTEVGLCPGHTVRWGPSPPPKGRSPPIFGSCLLWPNGRPSQLLPSSCFTYWLPDRMKYSKTAFDNNFCMFIIVKMRRFICCSVIT